jgi:hypothetical protein
LSPRVGLAEKASSLPDGHFSSVDTLIVTLPEKCEKPAARYVRATRTWEQMQMPEMKISRSRFVAALGGAVLIGVLSAGAAFAVQGHMVNARADLYAARNQLNMALADKAGHRVNAINLIDEAIGQVNAGIQAGAR